MWSAELLSAMDAGREPDSNNYLVEDPRPPSERAFADPDRLSELLHSSESGHLHMASLARQWQRRQENAVHLLRQQLDTLNVQRMEAEQRHRLIVEGHWSPRMDGDGFTSKQEDRLEFTSAMEEDEFSSSGGSSLRGSLVGSSTSLVDDNENSLQYWKERAKNLELLLAESMQREQVLLKRIQENGVQPPLSAPLEEFQENMHRLENFLHFTLRNAPIVIAHQDKELRYRFVYNAFPSISEEEILGKTDAEIYCGIGAQETMDFKREVLQKRRPMKREVYYDTDRFSPKTFLIAAEPVFNKSGEALGLNYVAIDITEEARKRESLIAVREDIAVQRAMETELHKTIDITEETMRAKQMLATMSHEIRSPLSGVVSIAELLGRTKLDAEQRQLVEVMMASGDLVLQLINDILDLSKVESGAMKLEAKKFRPREVVKHVLQMALAFVQNKHLTLEGVVTDDVPSEVVGDVLRIRQVFTNLVSNAVKFTHKGKVSIKVRMAPSPGIGTESLMLHNPGLTTISPTSRGLPPLSEISTSEEESTGRSPVVNLLDSKEGSESSEISRSSSTVSTVSTLSSASSATLSSSSSFSSKSFEDGKSEEERATSIGGLWDQPPKFSEQIWLHCEVYDTGIGIPEVALPSLFEKYTQVSTTHARKYGGTGLGLAICKQLVGLMGGTLEVKSKENVGSSFSFTLPLRAMKEKTSQGHLIDNKGWSMTLEYQDKLENSSKKRGYVHSPDGMISAVGSRGGDRPLIPGPDGKVKGLKSTHGKLKQLNRDSLLSNSVPWESCPVGAGNSKGEMVVANLHEGSTSEMTNDNLTRGSSVESLAVEPLELIQEECVVADPNTLCPPSAPLNLNSPRQSAGCQITIPSTQLCVQQMIPTCPPVDQRPQRSPRILLAEDNKVNVMVTQSMLKRLGHSLDVVGNGAEAVQALQRSDYDLILMDVSMPVMDGLEATRIIRNFEKTGEWAYAQDEGAFERSIPLLPMSHDMALKTQQSEVDAFCRPSRPQVPIIAMTANALADNVVECYHHGMDSFIAKPVTFQKLEQVLKQFVPWSECRKVEAS